MYEIKEMHGSVYCLDSDNGEILYELTEPAVVFSLDEYYTLHKIGNKDAVSKYYNKILERARGTDLADDFVLADLPKDVEILNKLYNNSGYLRVLFKDIEIEIGKQG